MIDVRIIYQSGKHLESVVQDLWQKLDRWFSRPLGRLLSEAESDGLENYLPRMFGYYVLQLGGKTQHDYLQHSNVANKFYVGNQRSLGHEKNLIVSKYDELPFLPNSLDAIVVPHILEQLTDPQKMLHEVYNILIPDGNVIIVGFNPFSLCGLRGMFADDEVPWGGKFISRRRMRKWLTRLGFTVIDYKTYFFRPPFASRKLLKASLFMEGLGQLLWSSFGGIYIMVANKKVAGVTAIKEKHYHRRQAPLTAPYAKPTSRAYHEKS